MLKGLISKGGGGEKNVTSPLPSPCALTCRPPAPPAAAPSSATIAAIDTPGRRGVGPVVVPASPLEVQAGNEVFVVVVPPSPPSLVVVVSRRGQRRSTRRRPDEGLDGGRIPPPRCQDKRLADAEAIEEDQQSEAAGRGSLGDSHLML